MAAVGGAEADNRNHHAFFQRQGVRQRALISAGQQFDLFDVRISMTQQRIDMPTPSGQFCDRHPLVSCNALSQASSGAADVTVMPGFQSPLPQAARVDDGGSLEHNVESIGTAVFGGIERFLAIHVDIAANGFR